VQQQQWQSLIPLLRFVCALLASSDKDRRYVVHAVNRVAEIFLAHSNGTLIANGVGVTSRISLQKMMSVTSVATVSSLVASEPVRGGGTGRGLVNGLGTTSHICLQEIMSVTTVATVNTASSLVARQLVREGGWDKEGLVNGLGMTSHTSLRKLMSVTTVATVSSLVAKQPVRGRP
jgi:hypothetical protein